jgi:hypothetical protein
MDKVATPPRAAGSQATGQVERRIFLFGDSHSHAIQRAIQKRQGKKQAAPLAAHRLLKEKNGKHIGDTTFEQFLEATAKLGPNDVVLSMIGGNQHAVFSTIQHPQPFDFFTPEGPACDPAAGLVPYRALEDTFVRGLRSGDGKSLEALRKATSARVVHIIPPPPKSDTGFIEKHHETRFAQEELARLGVSPPQLRLKFWRLQARVLEEICNALGIEVMMPPARAVDEEGFLRPEFYAQDATHANWRYGERVLREVERRYLRLKRSPDRGAE